MAVYLHLISRRVASLRLRVDVATVQRRISVDELLDHVLSDSSAFRREESLPSEQLQLLERLVATDPRHWWYPSSDTERLVTLATTTTGLLCGTRPPLLDRFDFTSPLARELARGLLARQHECPHTACRHLSSRCLTCLRRRRRGGRVPGDISWNLA